MGSHYNTCIHKGDAFTAYGRTFEPQCQMLNDSYRYAHCFHKSDSDLHNTLVDLTQGIWRILQHQAHWLEGKLKNDIVSRDELKRLRDEIKNMVLNGLEEKLKNAPYKGLSKEDLNCHCVENYRQIDEIKNTLKAELSQKELNNEIRNIIKELKNTPCFCKTVKENEKGVVTQEDLNIQTQEINNIVSRTSGKIEGQVDEVLKRFSGIKKEIENIIKEKDLDRKLGHTEKVIRDCLADVGSKISQLKKLGRDMVEEVRSSLGTTEIDKLILENSNILRKLGEGKLEHLVTKEDLVRKKDHEQKRILEKIEENNQLIKNFNVRGIENIIENQLKGILTEISIKIDKMVPSYECVTE